jgi:hypothetical protein
MKVSWGGGKGEKGEKEEMVREEKEEEEEEEQEEEEDEEEKYEMVRCTTVHVPFLCVLCECGCVYPDAEEGRLFVPCLRWRGRQTGMSTASSSLLTTSTNSEQQQINKQQQQQCGTMDWNCKNGLGT